MKILKSAEGNYYEFEAIVKHTTDEAILLDVAGKDVWFPLSVVEDINDSSFGFTTIVVPEWAAKDKEIV